MTQNTPRRFGSLDQHTNGRTPAASDQVAPAALVDAAQALRVDAGDNTARVDDLTAAAQAVRLAAQEQADRLADLDARIESFGVTAERALAELAVALQTCKEIAAERAQQPAARPGLLSRIHPVVWATLLALAILGYLVVGTALAQGWRP